MGDLNIENTINSREQMADAVKRDLKSASRQIAVV